MDNPLVQLTLARFESRTPDMIEDMSYSEYTMFDLSPNGLIRERTMTQYIKGCLAIGNTVYAPISKTLCMEDKVYMGTLYALTKDMGYVCSTWRVHDGHATMLVFKKN